MDKTLTGNSIPEIMDNVSGAESTVGSLLFYGNMKTNAFSGSEKGTGLGYSLGDVSPVNFDGLKPVIMDRLDSIDAAQWKGCNYFKIGFSLDV